MTEYEELSARVGAVEGKVDKLQESFDNHFTELKENHRLGKTIRGSIYIAGITALVKIIEIIAPLVL